VAAVTSWLNPRRWIPARFRRGFWGIRTDSDEVTDAAHADKLTRSSVRAEWAEGWSASGFDAVVDLSVLGDESGTLVDSELFARTIGIDPEAGPSVALVLRVPKRV
jgi:hypothetical protein